MKTVCAVLLTVILSIAPSACKSDKSGGGHDFYLNRAAVTLTAGQSEQLSYTSETDGQPDGGEVTFVSSAPAVVTVTADGVLTGVSEGMATVTATHTATGATDDCTVTVLRVPVAETALSLSRTFIELYAGDPGADESPESLTLVPTVTRNGQDVTYGYEVTWSTSDEAVAAVDENGRVTAVNPGTAYVTAAIDADGYPVTAVCTVIVDGVLTTLPDDTKTYLFDLSSYTQPAIPFADEVTAVRLSDTMESIPFSTADGTVTPDFTDISLRGRVGLVIESAENRMKTTAYIADKAIDSAAELAALTQTDTASQWYVLSRDIDFTDYLAEHPWTTANNLIPGTFYGVLDGDGHRVTGIVRSATTEELTASDSGFSQWEAGVFHTIAEGATVRNLYIETEQAYYQGSLLAAYVHGTLQDCYVKVSVTDVDSRYWGLRLAVIHQATGTITRCVFESAVPASNNNISMVYIPNPLGNNVTFADNMYIIADNTKGGGPRYSGGNQIFNRERARIEIGSVYAYKSVSDLLADAAGLVYDDTTDGETITYVSAGYTGNVFESDGWDNWNKDDTAVYLCGRVIVSAAE